MSENKFHYDAFISYRHTELDKFVAENLHKKLEDFRMPSVVAKKRVGLKNKIERVFRDKEELPLTSDLNDPIMNALHNSEWLIVICSPRLRESLWCKKEIETFVSLHGREHLLAVLIEGEPSESFPDELLFKMEKKTLPDGSVEEVKIPVEPLAADVRGKSKKEILKAMDTEVLRILAAMFGVNYDDLRQRHREQQQKRIMRWVIAGGIACLLFGLFCAGVAIEMHRQNGIIQALSDRNYEQQETLKYEQALNLAIQSRNYMEDDEREKAVQTAVIALTTYEDIFSMPYTPQAHGALIECLRCYDTGMFYQAQYQMETVGLVSVVRTSPDKSLVAILDEVARLYIWDVETDEVLTTLQLSEGNIFEDDFAFVDDSRIAYRSSDTTISVYDLNEQKVVWEMENELLSSVYVDSQKRYIIIDCAGNYEIYDSDTYTLIGKPEKPGKLSDYRVFFAEDEAVMAYTRKIETENGMSDYILFVDINTGKVISKIEFEEVSSFEIQMRDGIAYIAYDQYDENSESDTYIQAYDIVQGTIKWEAEIGGCNMDFMKIPLAENMYHLMVVGTNRIILINILDGTVVKEYVTEGRAVTAYASEEQNAYAVFTENSIFYYVDEINLTIVDGSDLFVVNHDKIKFYLSTKSGRVLIPYNSNRVINYNNQAGMDMVPVEWEGRELTDNFIWGDEAKTILAEYGAVDIDLVYGLYYDSKAEYMYVCYKDKRVSVYEVNGQLLLNTFEVDELPDNYLGTDSAGYTYLGAYSGGYVLGPNKELCTYIYGLKDVDLEKEVMYIQDDWGQCYEAPIYTWQELVEMAQLYIEVEEMPAEPNAEG